MGNNKKALQLIIDQLQDVEKVRVSEFWLKKPSNKIGENGRIIKREVEKNRAEEKNTIQNKEKIKHNIII